MSQSSIAPQSRSRSWERSLKQGLSAPGPLAREILNATAKIFPVRRIELMSMYTCFQSYVSDMKNLAQPFVVFVFFFFSAFNPTAVTSSDCGLQGCSVWAKRLCLLSKRIGCLSLCKHWCGHVYSRMCVSFVGFLKTNVVLWSFGPILMAGCFNPLRRRCGEGRADVSLKTLSGEPERSRPMANYAWR
jgi:hypothetical protein